MLLASGPALFSSCSKPGEYFGKVTPPRSQTLIYELGNSIDTPRFSDVWIDTEWKP
jgi:hypothetical protein